MESAESPPDLLAAYTATLETKAPGTVDVYTRILRQFTVWLATRPGSSGAFQPDQLTVTALDTYLKEREARGMSISHRTRIKTVVGSFAAQRRDLSVSLYLHKEAFRREDQQIAMLALHLLQISLVYVNTLMIQDVLRDQVWLARLTAEDYRALTPLIYSHVNPYGTFQLDMSTRLPIAEALAAEQCISNLHVLVYCALGRECWEWALYAGSH
jgi:hypothetical protein